MTVKINTLEIENVKRVKSVQLQCEGKSLVVIGGRNGAGKTSTLDSIAYALGGEKFRPTNIKRDESAVDPVIKIELSNGMTVERKGPKSSLKVTDKTGKRHGQAIIKDLIPQFALDLPAFLNGTDKEKADIVINIIGVKEELDQLNKDYSETYDKRLAVGRVADQKKKFFEELPYYSDCPEDLVTASELIERHKAILSHNAENDSLRRNLVEVESNFCSKEREVTYVTKKLEVLKAEASELEDKFDIALKSISELEDESTEKIEQDILDIDEINVKVRSNLDKEKAQEDAMKFAVDYDSLSLCLGSIKRSKFDLLNDSTMPLENLTINDGILIYNDQPWDCMSGSDQLKVATAIVRKLNPNCGFVLLDKLEQMDVETLAEFGEWLEKEDLQIIGTRVGTGPENSVIIEDGCLIENGPYNSDSFTIREDGNYKIKTGTHHVGYSRKKLDKFIETKGKAF